MQGVLLQLSPGPMPPAPAGVEESDGGGELHPVRCVRRSQAKRFHPAQDPVSGDVLQLWRRELDQPVEIRLSPGELQSAPHRRAVGLRVLDALERDIVESPLTARSCDMTAKLLKTAAGSRSGHRPWSPPAGVRVGGDAPVHEPSWLQQADAVESQSSLTAEDRLWVCRSLGGRRNEMALPRRGTQPRRSLQIDSASDADKLAGIDGGAELVGGGGLVLHSSEEERMLLC